MIFGIQSYSLNNSHHKQPFSSLSKSWRRCSLKKKEERKKMNIGKNRQNMCWNIQGIHWTYCRLSAAEYHFINPVRSQWISLFNTNSIHVDTTLLYTFKALHIRELWQIIIVFQWVMFLLADKNAANEYKVWYTNRVANAITRKQPPWATLQQKKFWLKNHKVLTCSHSLSLKFVLYSD